MQAMRDRWNQFFYEASTPLNLGLCRVLFFGAVLYLFRNSSAARWAEMSDASWQPVFLFQIFHLKVLSAEALTTLALIWKGALLLSCLGLLSRLSTITSAVLGFYLVALPYNFGKTDHATAMMLLSMAIFAVSKCGDAVSVDAVIRRLWKRKDSVAQKASWEYTWPIRLCWTLMTLIFFNAGVSKLREGGPEWIFSDNMANTFTLHHYIQHSPQSDLGLVLAQYPWVCVLLAAGTILVEVGAPLALFNRRLRWFFIPSLFLMQMGIHYMLNVGFFAFRICYLLWVPWDRVYLGVVNGCASGLDYLRGAKQAKVLEATQTARTSDRRAA